MTQPHLLCHSHAHRLLGAHLANLECRSGPYLATRATLVNGAGKATGARYVLHVRLHYTLQRNSLHPTPTHSAQSGPSFTFPPPTRRLSCYLKCLAWHPCGQTAHRPNRAGTLSTACKMLRFRVKTFKSGISFAGPRPMVLFPISLPPSSTTPS